MDGHIKLHRQFVEWEWYKNINVKTLFIHMLLKANWKDGKFQGMEIPRGSFISSVDQLAVETGLTVSQIRTAIKNLILTGELTNKTTNKYTVFTVNNYSKYQQIDKQDDKQIASDSQSNSNQIATIEEKKEEKEVEEYKTLSASQQKKTDVIAFFEDIWKLYPVKRGKAAVSFSQQEKLYKIGYEPMRKAIERYAKDLERDASWRKPQNGSTFFNKGYADYLDDTYKAPVIPQDVKKPKPNQFHNFEQRDTDYDAMVLERVKERLKAAENEKIKEESP